MDEVKAGKQESMQDDPTDMKFSRKPSGSHRKQSGCGGCPGPGVGKGLTAKGHGIVIGTTTEYICGNSASGVLILLNSIVCNMPPKR